MQSSAPVSAPVAGSEPSNPLGMVDFGPLTYDVWRSVVLAFVNEPGVGARESAVRRGIVACFALYGGTGFWSCITVEKRMPLSALDFALSKCVEGDLHLRFTLLDVKRLEGLPASPAVVSAWIDSVFDRLCPLASRWRSFRLDTENPVIFNRIRHRCADLEAYTLARLDLSYTYLPGYSLLADSQEGLLPFHPSSWFGSVLPSLVRISLYCVPFIMANDLLFEGLEVVDLACYDCPASLPVDVLPRLFALASRLRSLRLGTLVPLSLPEHYVLLSHSLQSLDLSFDSGPVAGIIFDALECPKLTELVVRDVRDGVHFLTACPVVLNRITVFGARGDIGDRISLQHLFAAMPRLETLDLVHSTARVFYTYCEWVRLCIRFEQTVWIRNLRSLALPSVELHEVVGIVNLVGESVFPQVGRIGVERLRVERPPDLDAEWNSVHWLRRIIPDFAFTELYSIPAPAIVSPGQVIDPDGDYSSLLDLTSFPSNKPSYPKVADLSRVYLWEDVAHILLDNIAFDPDLDLEALIDLRGRLIATSRWARYTVSMIAAFWTRLVISPRPHLDVVREWVELADNDPSLPLTIAFRATHGASVSPFFPNNNLEFWIDTAAAILASQLHRCVSLSIVADAPALLNDILFFVEGTRPEMLRRIDVRFGVGDYSHVRPPVLHDFSFLDLPPMGAPFRPCTSVSWTAGVGYNPSVSYITAEIASCAITHPLSELVQWVDVISVLTTFPLVETLVLSGLSFNYRPGTLTCSPPLHALTLLDVSFRGDDSMAQLVSRLNAPALRVLKLVVTCTRDVQCICSCPALLATIDELVVIGGCPAGNEFYAIYALLHRATRLDLRLASRLFYSAFAVASRRPLPRNGPNWNACPSLKHLSLYEVSLRDVQMLLLMRLSKGYPMVESVEVGDPDGGDDVTVRAWLAAHDRALHLPLERSPRLHQDIRTPSMCLRPNIAWIPPELLLDIFDEVIAMAGDGVFVTGHTFYLLTDVRDCLGQVDSRFRKIIHSHPMFWRQLYIDCNTSPDFVAYHVSRLGSLTIDVSISLTSRRHAPPSRNASSSDEESDSDEEQGPARTLDELAAVVKRCLLEAKPSVHLWRTADIWVSTDVFLLDLVNVFDTAAPQLLTLFLACPSLGTSYRSCDNLLVVPPSLFGHQLPMLTDLRLLSAALPWGLSEYFGGLESLDVQSIPRVAWPTIPSFVSSLTSSSTLRSLVLGGGGVLGGNAFVIAPFVLPCLEALTIAYSMETIYFFPLIAAGSFPALNEFTATGFDHIAWASACSFNFFPQLEHFFINCRRHLDNYSHVPTIIRRLRNVYYLDLSATTDCYVRELSRNSSTACPKLGWLSVSDMDITVLNTFVALRSNIPGRRLERLEYRHYYNPLTELQLALLEITRRYVDELVLEHLFP
ncbi:hypothetical protein C8R47DRAFT_1218506 [Mycena vitilis]|nr:hypothetical protein C8R47DRAFT_1218506 [Mycena vitilis]